MPVYKSHLARSLSSWHIAHVNRNECFFLNGRHLNGIVATIWQLKLNIFSSVSNIKWDANYIRQLSHQNNYLCALLKIYVFNSYFSSLTCKCCLPRKQKFLSLSKGSCMNRGVFIFFILFSLMEKRRQRKHRALIHWAHRPLSCECWDRPLFVHSYHGESGFQARLGLSWKIRWNQSVLNLFSGLESDSPSAALWRETMRSTGGSGGRRDMACREKQKPK